MKHIDIKELLNNQEIKDEITVCGWIKTFRSSKNVSFIELNDGTSLNNLQLVLNNTNDINNLTVGSSIMVKGRLVKSLSTKQEVELLVDSIEIIGKCSNDYPIQKKKQNMEYLREYPHLRARTNTFNAVFRVRNYISMAIHEYLQANNFIYVNTPIITGSNCEGAGKLFNVTTLDIEHLDNNKNNIYDNDFFGKKVQLSVSGQLEDEAMACSLGKVYSFGPSFRAENSNTKKHAAEFWIVEPEMAFADLNDIIEVINGLVKYLIQEIMENCSNEIDFFNKYYDDNLVKKLTDVLENSFELIDYKDAINILLNVKQKFDYQLYYGCDLKSEHIKYLTDIYFKKPIYIINYPKEHKPFYIKVNEDNRTVASADLYFPHIGDIIGACQKEDDYDKLYEKIKNLNMTLEDYYWYLELRKYGTVPHSGFGLGIERMVMYMTGMENIRDTTCFPRTKCKKLKL